MISSLLSRFEVEPKPEETLVQEKSKEFTQLANKSKRKSLSLSQWNDRDSIKTLSAQFEEKPESATTSTSFSRANRPPVLGGPGLDERRKMFLSPQRGNESATHESASSPKGPRGAIDNLDTDSNSALNKSRSRRSHRMSRTFSATAVSDAEPELVAPVASSLPVAVENDVVTLTPSPTTNIQDVVQVLAVKEEETMPIAVTVDQKPENDAPERCEAAVATSVEESFETRTAIEVVSVVEPACQEIPQEEEEALLVDEESSPDIEDTLLDAIPLPALPPSTIQEPIELSSPQEQEVYSITPEEDADLPPTAAPPTPPDNPDLLEGITAPSQEAEEEGPISLPVYLQRVRSGVEVPPSLELMNQGIGDDDIEELFDALEEFGQMERIELISLNGNDFEGRGADRIAKVLAKNYKFTSLDIAWNLIGPEGAQTLGEALQSNTHLVREVCWWIEEV